MIQSDCPHIVPTGRIFQFATFFYRHIVPTGGYFNLFSTNTSSLRDEYPTKLWLPTHRPYGTNISTRHVFYPYIVPTGRTPKQIVAVYLHIVRTGRMFQCATFSTDTSSLRDEYFNAARILPTHRPDGTNISMRYVFLPTLRPYGTNISIRHVFYRHIVPTGRIFQFATFSTDTSSLRDEYFNRARFSDTSSLRDEHRKQIIVIYPTHRPYGTPCWSQKPRHVNRVP